MNIARKNTKCISVGGIKVGGGARISVQTMTKTDTRDAAATLAQIKEVAEIGCDIVRLAVIDQKAAESLAPICRESPIPVIADIHFDHKLALIAIKAGVSGLRINPGNIGSEQKVAEVVSAAKDRLIPIRIGVNSGSIEKDILAKYGMPTAGALVESALHHVAILERLGYHEIKISVKASDTQKTIDAYRLLSAKTDYPLHLGVTEAGTFLAGTVRSSVALGILLAEGIGDTIRISLTDTPMKEVMVGLELLRSLGLRESGPSVISCPTCGRIQVDVIDIANQIDQEMLRYQRAHSGKKLPVVAVMGCMVNGPGEAKEADIAIAGGAEKFALYIRGEMVGTVKPDEALAAVMRAVTDF